ncbi:MAG: transketolase family protein [Eubacteriales bacterium]|nr:transketolase family protein [Eubacteriales bacterium]
MAEKKATRLAYGEALRELGSNEKIVALDGDVSTCTMSVLFGEKYPERFYNVGIAEANMIGMAAGLSTLGYIPFAHAFAAFMAGRGFDQIRNSVCYPHLNVKCVGTHAGLSVGEDGATHQCIEDIALMRSIPGMVVICPSDAPETAAAAKAVAEYEGPVYLRLGRLPVETVTDIEGYQFEIGKSVMLRNGKDVTIIAVGLMVPEAVKAAELLKEKGIEARVLDMHTIKPIDKEAIIAAVKETGCIVTAEEHNVLGGLGSAVAEVMAENCPAPVEFVGVKDCFGRSGNALKLLEMYHLTAEDISAAAEKAISRKK